MDYFLPLIEQAGVTDEFEAEKARMLNTLRNLEGQQRTSAGRREVRRAAQQVNRLQYDHSLSSSQNIQRIYTIVRSMDRSVVVVNGI